MLTCTFEDGGQTQILRHATVSSIIVNHHQILLVKRAPHMTCGNLYALPGGYMNNDERIIESAQREAFEETGYETHDPKLFLVNDIKHRKNEDRQNLDLIVLLQAGNASGTPDHESSEVRWFDLNHLPSVDQWAFDHFEVTQRYLEYQKSPVTLPILNFEY